jgi:hypothetical protein
MGKEKITKRKRRRRRHRDTPPKTRMMKKYKKGFKKLKDSERIKVLKILSDTAQDNQEFFVVGVSVLCKTLLGKIHKTMKKSGNMKMFTEKVIADIIKGTVQDSEF